MKKPPSGANHPPPPRVSVPGAPGRSRAGRQTGSRGYSGPGVRASRFSGEQQGGGGSAGRGGGWGEVGPRAPVRAQPCPPGDWPGSEAGGGVRRLRPRGWALLCVLPGISWVY